MHPVETDDGPDHAKKHKAIILVGDIFKIHTSEKALKNQQEINRTIFTLNLSKNEWLI